MKKRHAIFAVILGGLLLFIILIVMIGKWGVLGNGQVTTENIRLPELFMGAKTQTSIDIVVDASLSDKAVLEGESNILEWAVVSDEDGVLAVNYKPGLIISTRHVTLRVPYFNGGILETSSSGSITMAGSDPLTGDTFHLRVDSIGAIDVIIEAEQVNARSVSNGDITVEGSAENALIELSSMGSFYGRSFVIQNARLQLSSMGNAEVNVIGKLSGSTSSLGAISYDGDPSEIAVEGGNLRKR